MSINDDSDSEDSLLLGSDERMEAPLPPWYTQSKLVVIALIGTLMVLYSITEVGFALKFDSLVIFSDGLHNLSDGVALAVAFWAERKKTSFSAWSLTYGWRRTELLGGLFNGLFLLSMGLFVALQSIPDFINHTRDPSTSGYFFITISATGILLNLIGMFLFMQTGGGHGHSHGGGGHGETRPTRSLTQLFAEEDDDDDHEAVALISPNSYDRFKALEIQDGKQKHIQALPSISSPSSDIIAETGPSFTAGGHGHSHEGKHGHSHESKGKNSHSHDGKHGHSHESKGKDSHSHDDDDHHSHDGHSHDDDDHHSHDGKHGHSHESKGKDSHSHDDDDHHSHDGHSHDDDDHHSHDEKHGHSHESKGKDSHSHDGKHGHSHESKGKDSHSHDDDDHHSHDGHSHDDDDHHSHDEKHGHSHESKGKDSHSHDGKHGHSHESKGKDSHSHGPKQQTVAIKAPTPSSAAPSTKRESNHGHSHGSDSHGHGHADKAHGHGHDDHDDKDDHGHSHGKDHNIWGLFLHFLSDVLTSTLVLAVGLIYHFQGDKSWVSYADPTATLLSVIIICFTAWPLVRDCSWILLQSSPSDIPQIRSELKRIPHVKDIHELHVWQLVDGLTIASVHVIISKTAPWELIMKRIKIVLHSHHVHSVTAQPEYSDDDLFFGACIAPGGGCIDSCEAESCCPTPAFDSKEFARRRSSAVSNLRETAVK